MRVYELAKSYNLESKDVLLVAKKHRIDVKSSASAALDDKDIRKLHPLLEAYKKEVAAKDSLRPKSTAKKAASAESVETPAQAPAPEQKPVPAAIQPVHSPVDDAAKRAEERALELERRRRALETAVNQKIEDKKQAEAERVKKQEDAAAAAKAAAAAVPPPTVKPRVPLPITPPVTGASPAGEPAKSEPKSPGTPTIPSAAQGATSQTGTPQSGTAQGARPSAPTANPGTSAPTGIPKPTVRPGGGLPTGPARPPIIPSTPLASNRPQGPRPIPGGGSGGTGRSGLPVPGAGRRLPGQGGEGRDQRREGSRPVFSPESRGGEQRSNDNRDNRENREGRDPRDQRGGQSRSTPPSPGSSLPRGPAPRPMLNQPPQERPERSGPRPGGGGQFGGRSQGADRGGYRTDRADRGDRGPRPEGFDPRGPRPAAGDRGPRPERPAGDRQARPGFEQRPRTPLPPRRDQMPGRSSDGDRDRDNQRSTGNPSEPGSIQIGVMRMDKPVQRRPGGQDKKPAAAKAKGKAAPRKIFELDEDLNSPAKPRTVPGDRGRQGKGAPMDPAFGKPRFGSRRRPKKRNMQGGGGSAQYNELGQRSVFITPPLTVGEFAAACQVPVTEIIKRVMLMGEMLNVNAHMSEELMELLAPDLNIDLEIERVGDEFDIEAYLPEPSADRLIRRAPVVTIMGHVDHGKTSLLDYIRRAKVAEGEFGGITQHIGAYHVTTSKGPIVFLDTPGHEAFTSMRARGAQITDIVILVVAADDGFKPQTIEALNHAQAAQVPIVVAVNKIDLPGADPNRVRQEALKHNLIPEELGGEVMFVDVSAKKGINVENLLESVALQAELLELTADPETTAMGLVIESKIDPNRGAVATILVEQGTLRVGDDFVCGDVHGRVRAMLDDRGREVQEAGPSTPVEILGLSDSPGAGEVFLVVPDEQIARGIAEKRFDRRRTLALAPVTHRHMTLETLHEHMREGESKYLNVILKADVQGSIEAVAQALEKLSNDQIRIRILHSAVGGVTENDVNLAAASDAIIFGFNVRPDARTETLAEQEGIDIKTYRIIYDLLEDVKAAMSGLLSPTKREKILGHAEVLQLFRISRLGTIAGCIVRDGEIIRSAKVRLLRQGVVVYEGQLASLKRLKDDVRKVTSGLECGMAIENYNDLKEGDIIEAYEIEEVAGELQLSSSDGNNS